MPTTDWLTPTPIRGLDHLGVQASCVALYTELLPGITNVTRPRFLWSFDDRSSDHSDGTSSALPAAVSRYLCKRPLGLSGSVISMSSSASAWHSLA